MSGRTARRRRSRGQALVEFAIIAPLLLVLLTGAAQVAVVVYSQLAVDTAAREAARTGSDNPMDSQLFPAATTKNCSSPTDARKACVAAFHSSSRLFGLVNPANFTVNLSSQQFPTGSPTTACAGASGTADDGVITAQVSTHAPIFVPFVNRFFSDPGQPYRTVSSSVDMRVSPCAVNGGN